VPVTFALSCLPDGVRAQILQRLTATAPKTVRGRGRTPALVRHHARLAVDGPVHET